MQTLLEAASHIAQEIERTRQHLTNLEQALEGLKPLITIEAATTTLTYSASSQAEPVEDLSVVNAETRAKKRTKTKVVPKTKESSTKAVKAKVAHLEKVVEPIKLPSTGNSLWLKCIGRKKMTVAQLADAALKKLNLDDAAREVITSRAKAWAYTATKKGELIEIGIRNGAKLYQLATANETQAIVSVQSVNPTDTIPVVEVSPVVERAEAS